MSLRDRAVNPFDDEMGDVDENIFGGFEQEPERQIVEVAQTPSPTGVIEIGKFLTTPRGIEAYDADVSYEDWLAFMGWLRSVGDSRQWMIGDAALIGAAKLATWLGVEALNQDDFESAYQQLIAATGYSYSSVTKFASMARIYPFVRRRKNAQITYKHHAVLRKLAPAQQDEWLDKAERERWSANELARRLKTNTLPAPRPMGDKAAKAFDRKLERFKSEVVQMRSSVGYARRMEWVAQLRALADELEGANR